MRIPTSTLKGIDLRDVRAVELRTDRVASGSVFISDLAFSKPDPGKSAPSRLPRLSASTVKVAEGNSGTKNVDFWVTMSRPNPLPVSVYVETNGDLGTSVGEVARKLVFRPGQTRQKVTVPITGNTRDSYDLDFALVLSAPRQALLGQSFGRGRVIDDDPTPTLTIGPGSAKENEEFLTFPVKLSAPSDQYVSLSGVLKDGTAVITKDYRVPGQARSAVVRASPRGTELRAVQLRHTSRDADLAGPPWCGAGTWRADGRLNPGHPQFSR